MSQALFDQLLARGWIEDGPMWFVMETYRDIVGGYPDGLERVSPHATARKTPCRAYFAQQWPKLSAWLWKQKARELRTGAMEDRIVRLLADRRYDDRRRGQCNAEGRRAARFAVNASVAAWRGAKAFGSANRANYLWGVTKPVRSK